MEREGASPLVHLVIILTCLVWILPTLGLLVSSVRPAHDVAATGWWTVLRNPFDLTQYTLQNYREVLGAAGMGRAFVNSLIITIPATLLTIGIAAFAAFAFAWSQFPGRDALFLVVVGLLVVPLQMTLIPILRLYSRLGLAGTFVGIWLAHVGYGLPFAIYLLRNFFGSLPRRSLRVGLHRRGLALDRLLPPGPAPVGASPGQLWASSSSFGCGTICWWG